MKEEIEKIPIEKLLNYELVELMGLDIVTCSECCYKDTGLCRCTKKPSIRFKKKQKKMENDDGTRWILFSWRAVIIFKTV